MKALELINQVKLFSKKINDDHVSAFSAQAAFFIVLSAFPFIIFLLSLIKLLPFDQADLVRIISSVFPQETSILIDSVIQELYNKTSNTLLSLSVLTTLWSASKGILSLVQGLNVIYEAPESRNYLILRIVNIIYTILFTILLVSMLVLIVFGNRLYHYIIRRFPLLIPLADFLKNFRVLFIAFFLITIFSIMYIHLPNRSTNWKHQIPGAIISSVSWLVVSYAFSFWLDRFTNYSYMYGSLTGVIVTILWLYFMMNLFFIGAEINYYLYPNKAPDI